MNRKPIYQHHERQGLTITAWRVTPKTSTEKEVVLIRDRLLRGDIIILGHAPGTFNRFFCLPTKIFEYTDLTHSTHGWVGLDSDPKLPTYEELEKVHACLLKAFEYEEVRKLHS